MEPKRLKPNSKGLFTWSWRTPGRWGTTPRWSYQSLRKIPLNFFLRSRVKWGTSPRGVAKSAEAGNPLSWGEFSLCECWRWERVMFIRIIIKGRQNNMAINQYKHGELFRWCHLQKNDNDAIEESSECADDTLVEFDIKPIYRSWMKLK